MVVNGAAASRVAERRVERQDAVGRARNMASVARMDGVVRLRLRMRCWTGRGTAGNKVGSDRLAGHGAGDGRSEQRPTTHGFTPQ